MNGPEPQNQIILHVSPQQALAPFLGAQVAGGGPVPGGEEQEPPSIDFGGIFQALKRRWWIVALCFLGIVSLGVIYILKAQRVFEAKGVVEVEQEVQSIVPTQNTVGDLKSLEMLRTIEATINSDSFMLRVIKSARLKEDPTWAPPREMPYNDDELVFFLQKKATASLGRGNRLIELKVQDSDPDRATRIANAFLQECVRSHSDEDMAAARIASAGLKKELDESLSSLESSDLDLKQKRAEYPDLQLETNPNELKPNTAETRVATLSASVLAAQEEVVKLTNGFEQVRAGRGNLKALLDIKVIASATEITDLQKMLTEKQTAFNNADARYLAKHPTHIKTSKELAGIQKALLEAAQRQAAGLENTLATAQANVTKLQEELATAKESARNYQRVAAEFARLVDENKTRREHHKDLSTRLKRMQVNENFGGNVLKINSPPIRPTWPVKPDKKLVLAGSGVAGMALGIGIVLLLYFLDRSVRNMEQGEQVFSLPGLAAVPDCPAKHPMDRLLSSPYTKPESAEAFRAMRTSLSLLGKGVHARSILFTSPDAGDGKSYCAANYALTLAQQGYRTLLVDADLRKPSLDLLLLGRRNPAGLITHLKGGAQGEGAKACTPTSIPNLFLFSAGEAVDGHPAELLNSQAFRDLLADALKWFHRVVIDTPPVNVVTDALLLAREVDSVALVVRAGKTSRQDVKQAIRKLSTAGARPVGFILNAAPKEALTKGYTGEYNHAMINPNVPTRLSLPEGRQS